MVTARDVRNRRIASNLAAVEMDLTGATIDGDRERVALLRTLSTCGGDILLYRPQLQHYALLFGDIEFSPHVAVIVPGVGDGATLLEEWIPEARQLFDTSPSTAVIVWKGYDNPVDGGSATAEPVECNDDLVTAASELTAFVEWLELDSDQSMTVVAHGFGSVVTAAALADCGLEITDARVTESPGMTADELRNLHIQQAHPVSGRAQDADAPESWPDIFGVGPVPPASGEAPVHAVAHGGPEMPPEGEYSEVGPQVVEDMSEVITGRFGSAPFHRDEFPEIAGSLVTWTLRIPARPVCRASQCPSRVPGTRFLATWCRVVDVGAEGAGTAVRLMVDGGEQALGWLARRVGALAEGD